MSVLSQAGARDPVALAIVVTVHVDTCVLCSNHFKLSCIGKLYNLDIYLGLYLHIKSVTIKIILSPTILFLSGVYNAKIVSGGGGYMAALEIIKMQKKTLDSFDKIVCVS